MDLDSGLCRSDSFGRVLTSNVICWIGSCLSTYIQLSHRFLTLTIALYMVLMTKYINFYVLTCLQTSKSCSQRYAVRFLFLTAQTKRRSLSFLQGAVRLAIIAYATILQWMNVLGSVNSTYSNVGDPLSSIEKGTLQRIHLMPTVACSRESFRVFGARDSPEHRLHTLVLLVFTCLSDWGIPKQGGKWED